VMIPVKYIFKSKDDGFKGEIIEHKPTQY